NCKGNITLSAVEGGDKIKIWTTQNKAEEVKLPKVYKPGDLPVTLWVEGILSSKKQNDIKLQLVSDDPEHSDLVVMTAVVLDLDVNTNRDEVIDDKDDAKEGEDVDYQKTGALVLANLDDDAGESKTDTSDNVITSEKDFDDFSKMIVRKMVPPKDFHAQLTIRSGGEFIRVFKELKKGAISIMGYEGRGKPVPLQYLIPDADLAKGDVEFFIEGIRPGKQAAIYLELANGDMILDVCEDSVKILVTPLIFHSNIRPTKRVFYAEWKGGHSNDKFTKVFKDESAKIVGAGNVIPLTEMKSGGIFAQDIFEIGYQQNPANHAGKPITMPTVLDNPWQIHGFSHYPAESLLKPDFGLQRGESPLISGSEYVDKIGGDYGGNLEVIPPFQPDLPYGQLVIGDNMEEQLRDFLIDQKVQAKKKKILVVLPVDPEKGSSVFHVDEVFNVVPAGGDKKFKVVVGDLDLAIALLKASTLAALKPLKDKYLSTKKEDVAAMKAIRDHLDKVKTVLKTDGDLADADIVPIPVLYPFEFTTGYGVPNAVNLQVVDSKIFIPLPIYDKSKDAVFLDMQKDIQKRLTAA
ncbi:MAG TPA: protein-arginine deiminase family protein, partial [Saprospiraceae bacterium]|nr:protein-arginine deiminase family protein [Saprospiraceae bacterium]